jgi:hypothetical protein
VKKAIELLNESLMIIPDPNRLLAGDIWRPSECLKAKKLISTALDILKSPPGWETPEQWEKRTGEPWKGTVYFNIFSRKDGKSLYVDGQYQISSMSNIVYYYYVVVVVCATEARPPPDGWKPEGE